MIYFCFPKLKKKNSFGKLRKANCLFNYLTFLTLISLSFQVKYFFSNQPLKVHLQHGGSCRRSGGDRDVELRHDRLPMGQGRTGHQHPAEHLEPLPSYANSGR